MGGLGSGRTGRRATTESRLSIDIRQMKRRGGLVEGVAFTVQWGAGGVSESFRTEADRLIVMHPKGEYVIRLDRTPEYMGGARAWFRCPALRCNRRVAILYRSRAQGSMLACRHCYRLAYQCQRETTDHRAIRRANKIRRRLNWDAGPGNPEGTKPKGMHWTTFDRLTAEQEHYAMLSMRGLLAFVQKLTARKR